MDKPYDDIAKKNYSGIAVGPLFDQELEEYFDNCFQDAIEHFQLYPSWACVECLRGEVSTHMWGEKPLVCPICKTENTYAVATFQARSSVVGTAFERSFALLLNQAFSIRLDPSPRNSETHDFELAKQAVFELKGSPSQLKYPNGQFTKLSKPGMERSDTKKKAFDNAKTFRGESALPFYIVSNAVPQKWVGFNDEYVSGVFDVTKEAQLRSLVDGLHRSGAK